MDDNVDTSKLETVNLESEPSTTSIDKKIITGKANIMFDKYNTDDSSMCSKCLVPVSHNISVFVSIETNRKNTQRESVGCDGSTSVDHIGKSLPMAEEQVK